MTLQGVARAGADAAKLEKSLLDKELIDDIHDFLSRGDSPGAIARCRARIVVDPTDAVAYRHLALLLMASGQQLAAQRAAERACELAPGDAPAWVDLGRVHAMQGHYGRAAKLFDKATEVGPGCADAWHNLGLALRRLRDDAAAFRALKQALLIDAKRAETCLALGNLLVDAGQLDDAVECYERAARHDPTLARARSRLAQQLSARGRVVRAEKLFRDSLGLDPEHVPGWLALAGVLEDLGESDAALACYRNALARAPDHAAALGRCLALDAGTDAVLLTTARARLAAEDTPHEARALIGYGLARHHENRREYLDAAESGRLANAQRRRVAGPLDRAALVARIDGLMLHTREFFAERRGFGLGNDQPVFIVGLPRSGTTLTEQILASHPLVHGAGELNELARVAVQNAADPASPWTAAAALDAESSRVCAGEYLAALRSAAPQGRVRFIDKAPLNFFQLGFIALLFPNARVIHCVRDARDNALSIWMENFNASQTYATDFDDLAFFHAQYRRLMAHWQEHLPLEILECRYEDTVAGLDAQARRLIDFLQLPWDSRCLRFHESARAVQTPSRWQVRQPLYSSSVARWRRYEPFLPELMAAFGSVHDTDRTIP